MKILITTDLYTVTTNGVVTSVKNLYDELTKSGHEVRILTLSGNQHSHKDGAVYYIRSVSLGAVYPDVRMPTSYRHKLIRELIAWKPDIIHSQCEFFTFQYAARIARRTGAPIVHTYHTLYEQYVKYLFPSRRLGKRVVRVASRKRLKHVERVIAPTHKVEDALRDYGLNNPIEVIPSGISLEQHRHIIGAETRQCRRRELGISDEDLVLLNLGRLGTEKNLEELVRYFSKAAEKYEHIKFLVVGDGPARKQLEKLSRELELGDRVIFTGMVEPGRVQEYYQLGDLFVSASTSETQGLTYIEACANGLPLLCRADPCLADVLQEGENGYSYTDEEGFLQAVDAVMADPRWRQGASERSRQIADTFDKHAFGHNVEELYEEVLQK